MVAHLDRGTVGIELGLSNRKDLVAPGDFTQLECGSVQFGGKGIRNKHFLRRRGRRGKILEENHVFHGVTRGDKALGNGVAEAGGTGFFVRVPGANRGAAAAAAAVSIRRRRQFPFPILAFNAAFAFRFLFSFDGFALLPTLLLTLLFFSFILPFILPFILLPRLPLLLRLYFPGPARVRTIRHRKRHFPPLPHSGRGGMGRTERPTSYAGRPRLQRSD